MYLGLVSIVGIVILSCVIGALITYFTLKPRISSLKEEMLAYKRSLKGLWESHEQRQRLRSSKEAVDTPSTEAASSPLLSTIQAI